MKKDFLKPCCSMVYRRLFQLHTQKFQQARKAANMKLNLNKTLVLPII